MNKTIKTNVSLPKDLFEWSREEGLSFSRVLRNVLEKRFEQKMKETGKENASQAIPPCPFKPALEGGT